MIKSKRSLNSLPFVTCLKKMQQNFNGLSLDTGFFSPTPGNTTKEIISLITSKARFVYPVVRRRESTHYVPRSNWTLNIVFKQFKFINSPFLPLCILFQSRKHIKNERSCFSDLLSLFPQRINIRYNDRRKQLKQESEKTSEMGIEGRPRWWFNWWRLQLNGKSKKIRKVIFHISE